MFLTEGPLDPQSPLFVGREAELRTMEQWLAYGNCVGAVAGARQTGKTSLLLQLRHRYQAKYRFVFIDLEALQNAAEGDCYGFICQEILDQLSDEMSDVSDCSLACNSASFLAFLRNVSRKISAVRIAIILDEIGALPDATATALASTIRAIFTSRHVRADYGRYIFILSGSTDIRRFATGKSSPIYNVTEKVYLSDLSSVETNRLLVAGFSANGLQVPEGIRSRVLHWTAGHPYLTQLLGKRIVAFWEDTQSLPDESQVDQIIGTLLQEEDKTLPHMRRVLDKGASRLWGLVTDALQGKKIRFSRSDDDLAELELAGAMVPQDGVCFIRNRIFQMALRSWMDESQSPLQDTRSTADGVGGSQADATRTSGSRVTASGERGVAFAGNLNNSVIIIGDGNILGDNSSSRVDKGSLPTRPDRPSESCQTLPTWNTATLRDLLGAAFSDEELTTLCFDHFRSVYEDFATGMSKGQKIQRLLDYCIRYEQMEALLVTAQKANPAQYRRFEGSLRG